MPEYPAELTLPVGKLPPELLKKVLDFPTRDSRVLLGPGIGLDCAVLDFGESLLVIKSDPITFVVEDIGWYAVTIAANDLATTGATPRWYLPVIILPSHSSTGGQVLEINRQIRAACQEIGVEVVGGHTEISSAVNQVVISGTLIGEVKRQHLITPKGARPGDALMLTKGVPIEAVSIMAREIPERFAGILSQEQLNTARDYLFHPGISITTDASLATHSGRVTAMHDPTEGGLSGALWELAEASQLRLIVDLSRVQISEIAQIMCQQIGIDPFAAISSGALLFTCHPDDATAIQDSLSNAGISCSEIGFAEEGPPQVINTTHGLRQILNRPLRDEIARIFETQ